MTRSKTSSPPPPEGISTSHPTHDPGSAIAEGIPPQPTPEEELAAERRKSAFLLAAYNRFRASHGMAPADEAAAVADGGGP